MYKINMLEATQVSQAFRRVLSTTEFVQVAGVALNSGEEISSEIRESSDQVFIFTEGQVCVRVGDFEDVAGPGDSVVVPAGSGYNFTNIGESEARFIALCGSFKHAENLTKENAQEAESERADLPLPDF